MGIKDLIRQYIIEEFRPRRVKYGKLFRNKVKVNGIYYNQSDRVTYVPRMREHLYIVFGVKDAFIEDLLTNELR